MYKRWVVFAAFFCTGICQAQISSSALNGTITDATGSVVPKASVTVTSTSTGFARSVVASDGGAYAVSDIPPGESRFNCRKFRPFSGMSVSSFPSITVPTWELLSWRSCDVAVTATDSVTCPISR